jgi:hypothetical protein
MFSLAAIAVIATTAFVGASLASAEGNNLVLCQESELICEEENQWPNPTEIVLKAEDPRLLTSIGTELCTSSLAKLTLLNSLAKLITGHLLSLSFAECKLGTTQCTVEVIETGGLSFTHEAFELLLARAEFAPLEEKGTVLRLKCGLFINCTMYLNYAQLTAHSSESGLFWLLANETILTKTKGIWVASPNCCKSLGSVRATA